MTTSTTAMMTYCTGVGCLETSPGRSPGAAWPIAGGEVRLDPLDQALVLRFDLGCVCHPATYFGIR